MAVRQQLIYNTSGAVRDTDHAAGHPGQLLIAYSDTIISLYFHLQKIGNPPGNLKFQVWDGNTGALLNETDMGAANAFTTDTWVGGNLSSPVAAGNNVIIAVWVSAVGDISNQVCTYNNSTDVAPNENIRYTNIYPTFNDTGMPQANSTGDLAYSINQSPSNNESSVSTQVVVTKSTTTATLPGTVIDVGDPAATQYGHIWTKNPAYKDLPIGDGSAGVSTLGTPVVGTFNTSATSLTPNTQYWYQAYIVDLNGTHYGGILTFTTDALTSPTITTQACTSITSSNAVGNGNIGSAGEYTITHHGIVWSTLPMLGDQSTVLPSASYAETESAATGAFFETIIPLLVNTAYYARAYVKTSAGLYFFGNQVSFTTSGGLPIVTTQLVTSVSSTTATGNLTLVSNGGTTITQYGVVYSAITHADPGNVLPSASAYENYTAEGAYSITPWPVAGVPKTSAISLLVPNTTYYLRAYAANGTGTTYGVEVSFKTRITGAPTVTTDDLFAMTYTTVTARGTIVDLGSSAVTAHGHVWDTSPNPTVALGTKTDNGAGSVGQFATTPTGLTPGTTYYVRSYATNTQGPGYGDNIEFVAGTPPAGGGTYFTPANAYTRITAFSETFWAGTSGQGTWQQVLYLGGDSTTFVSPIDKGQPQGVVDSQVANSGLQYTDYIGWLNKTDIITVLKSFNGFYPDYNMWVKWRKVSKQ